MADSPDTIAVEQNTDSVQFTDGVEYHIDETGQLTIDQLLRSSNKVNWKATGPEVANFGFDWRTYWYRLSLILDAGESREFLLQTGSPLIDYLDVYYVRGGKVVHQFNTGDMEPFYERPVQNRNFVFPLELSSEQATDIYLRVSTDSPQMMPLILWKPVAFDQQDRNLLMGHSFYYGIIFVMIIYNLAVFFSVRDTNYLYYVGSIAAFALFDASMNGYTFQHFWQESVHWNDHGPMTFLNLFILFRALFVFNFLNLRELGPRFIWLHRGFMAVAVFSLASVFLLPISFAIVIGMSLGLFGLVLGLVEGGLSWSYGQRHARLFVVGWVVFTGSLLVHLFVNAGVIPLNSVTIHITQIGSAMEVILFTFALAYRVRLVDEERSHLELQAKEALLEANRSLEESLRVKNDFLATISHELRTPMNGVLSSVESILKSDNMEEIKRLGEIGNQSALEMMGMVEGILGYAEMQSGQTQLEEMEFSLQKMCDDVVREFKQRAAARHLLIRVEVPDMLPDRLVGDKTRIQRILACLLDNAIKFTHEGSVSLRVEAQEQLAETETGNNQRTTLYFHVCDSGIGVPPDSREQIFEKFHQVDSSYHRRYGGLGLGLSISRQLASAMGGELTYEPGPEGGSCFTLALGLAFLPDRRETGMERTGGRLPQSARILVVEDNNVNQMVMKGLLKKFGMEATIAENGEIAVEMAQKEPFDMILMDLQMPVMDGFEATRAIRSLDLPVASAPIVAVTANVMDSDRARCRECGMNDFVSKPVKQEKMEEIFQKWLRADPP